MEILLTIAVFGLAMGGLGIGLIAGRALRGSCGGLSAVGPDGEPMSCGACPKREAEVCPSDDPVVAAARRAYPGVH
ncbi:MAG: hypothetical protein R3F59_17310 [Myxococcota bacterium]